MGEWNTMETIANASKRTPSLAADIALPEASEEYVADYIAAMGCGDGAVAITGLQQLASLLRHTEASDLVLAEQPRILSLLHTQFLSRPYLPARVLSTAWFVTANLSYHCDAADMCAEVPLLMDTVMHTVLGSEDEEVVREAGFVAANVIADPTWGGGRLFLRRPDVVEAVRRCTEAGNDLWMLYCVARLAEARGASSRTGAYTAVALLPVLLEFLYLTNEPGKKQQSNTFAAVTAFSSLLTTFRDDVVRFLVTDAEGKGACLCDAGIDAFRDIAGLLQVRLAEDEFDLIEPHIRDALRTLYEMIEEEETESDGSSEASSSSEELAW